MEITTYKQASEIWIQFKARLYSFVKNKVHDHELAEEINSQVLQKLINSCCSGNEIQNLSSWMYRIAYNTLLDELKKQNQYASITSEHENDETSKSYSELTEFIEPLIGFLPEKYAVPLIMADIEGIKQQEVAERLGLSISGAKSRIQRARELLRKEISTCFHLDQENQNSLNGFRLKATCEPLQRLIKKKT